MVGLITSLTHRAIFREAATRQQTVFEFLDGGETPVAAASARHDAR